MIKTIQIQENPPRDISSVKADVSFSKGLYPLLFFGYFINVAVVLIAVMYFFIPGADHSNEAIVRLIIAACIFDFIGAMFLVYAARIKQRRIFAFQRGIIKTGRVVQHGRCFVFWKSSRNYTITVELVLESGERITSVISSSSEELQRMMLPGTDVVLLYDSIAKTIFVPQEVGVVFSV